MNPKERRRWPRGACEVPIKYCLGSRRFHDGTMMNNSKDGLCFVGQKPLKEGDVFHVLIDWSGPDFVHPCGLNFCDTTVKWCLPKPALDETRFGVGVQVHGWRASLDGREMIKIFHRCDVCELPTPCDDIVATDGPLYLCPKCIKRLHDMPECGLKASVQRFLLGNVL